MWPHQSEWFELREAGPKHKATAGALAMAAAACMLQKKAVLLEVDKIFD